MENRRELAQGKEIWVIKAGFPNTPAGKNWSDYVFAHSLKKYLERLGHYVLVESYDEWVNDYDADAVVVLRGLKRYFPDRTFSDRIYIMWNLSHPDQVTDEEYNSYDLVCTSSEPYGKKLQERLKVPVEILPMCADTEIFYPDSDPHRAKEYDWIFVGNSRNMERKCVTWSVKHGLPLKIWGANWEKFVPESEKHVVAENMPNDQLPELYRNAKVTVCDHYEDMIKNGFINTRIVESFACGLPVISDYSEVLEKMFGDAILCYRDEAEFVQQAERITREYAVIQEKVRALWPVIREKYSFETCARQLSIFAGEIRKYGEVCENQVEALIKASGAGRGGTPDRASKAVHEGKPGENIAETEPNRIERIYQCFCELEHRMGESYDSLTEALHDLQKEYKKLTWREQQAFARLKGSERLLFECFVQPKPDTACESRELYEEREKVKSLQQENGRLNDKLRMISEEKDQKLQAAYKEKAKINQKLQEAYKEKSEINRKLQDTYKEKSEINRKLQITYGEKYDRGQKIKSLEKELAAVKNSRTYRLARFIGFPVRFLRKLIKKMKE